MAATQRAYSLEDMKLPVNAHLKPDIQYYLAQQVHPVVSRLCELLDGIDAVRIAEFLGIVCFYYFLKYFIGVIININVN